MKEFSPAFELIMPVVMGFQLFPIEMSAFAILCVVFGFATGKLLSSKGSLQESSDE